MPCYHPIKAWVTPTGQIVHNVHMSKGPSFMHKCGRCVGCKIAKSKEWAIRCVHEAQIYEEEDLGNSYLTLTYNQDHLPQDASLDKGIYDPDKNTYGPNHFQKFIRSLRKKTGQKMRYYMCGEYGGKTQRPHYHAILFGYEFPDKKHWYTSKQGYKVWRSDLLEETWTKGNSEIGTVTFKSAAYVARYIMKKQTNKEAKGTLAIVDSQTGEITGQRLAEYTNMSLKPGIGTRFYEKYKGDIFPQDIINHNGKNYPVPDYYRSLLEKDDPELNEKLKLLRIERAKSNPDNTRKRLAVREVCQNAKLNRLPRTLE